MKWPFVKRSKYDNLQNQVNCLNKIYSEYAQLNHDNLVEINRLNEDLANELNSHRETKAHEQKLFQEYDKINQQNMGLLFDLQEIKDKNNQLLLDKQHLKTKIKETESDLSKLKVKYTETKQQNDWFYGNYCRFKDMIEKSGYFPGK